jgi:hypothetical protein
MIRRELFGAVAKAQVAFYLRLAAPRSRHP